MTDKRSPCDTCKRWVERIRQTPHCCMPDSTGNSMPCSFDCSKEVR